MTKPIMKPKTRALIRVALLVAVGYYLGLWVAVGVFILWVCAIILLRWHLRKRGWR